MFKGVTLNVLELVSPQTKLTVVGDNEKLGGIVFIIGYSQL
jgi:hypothetical protein